MTPDELIEAVAKAIDDASKNARLGQDWQWFIPEARAAIRVIAPAVLEEAATVCAVMVGNHFDRIETQVAIRAMKTRYEQ